MKPRPIPESKPNYPSRRTFIRQFGLIAAGVGLGAVSLPPARANDLKGEVKMPEPKKGKVTFCAKTCGKEIDKYVALLGDEDFRKRRDATKKLIAMGKAKDEPKPIATQKRTLVIARMTALKKAKDPEVAKRAESIIVALTPPKPLPPPPPRFKGVMIRKR